MSIMEEKQWFVMRDLKRVNAKLPAYKLLQEMGIEYFTPMKWILLTRNEKRIRREVPFMQDLLFVHDTKSHLDSVLRKVATLQYRFQKGKAYQEPMVVRDGDMERFMQAVSSVEKPHYFLPDELNESFYGHTVRIVGGMMDGYEGRLMRLKGSKKKQILVELPNWLTVAVEVNPEYIEVLK